MERRRLLLSNEYKRKTESSAEETGSRTYIFKDGEMKLGSILSSHLFSDGHSYTQKALQDGMIYVSGGSKVQGSSAQTYVFPADKGWTSQEQVANYYKEQGYDNIVAADIQKSTHEGNTYFVPISGVIDKKTFRQEGTLVGGSIKLGDYELNKYKYIGFTVQNLIGSGNVLIDSKETNSFWGGNREKEICTEVSNGENRVPLPELTEEEGYKVIIFKCSSTGKPVYKITEIYLEE